MARLEPYTTQSFSIDYPAFISAPTEWKKAEKAYIRLSIDYREQSVGTLDLAKFIPREFCGYYYLIRSGAIIKYAPIEFKHQEIYFDKHLWTAEQTIQGTLNDLSTIDTDIDNVDETSRLIGLTGGFVLSFVGNLDIPLIDFGVEALQDLVDAIASDDLYYFPSPDRPDKIAFSIPDGLVGITVEFGWISYSPAMVVGGLAEVPIESEIEIINPTELAGLGAISEVKTFSEIAEDKGFFPLANLDSIARNEGYIQSSECSASAAESLKNRIENSTTDLQKLIGRLLTDGAILQSDIDAIKAVNPTISNEDLLKELIDLTLISSTELDRAIERAVIETYVAPPNKKSGWFIRTVNNSTPSCQPLYNISVITGTPNVSANLSPNVSNASSPPAINWSPTFTSSVYLYPYVQREGIQASFCNDIRDVWRVFTGGAAGGNFFHMRSFGTPEIFFAIQP